MHRFSGGEKMEENKNWKNIVHKVKDEVTETYPQILSSLEFGAYIEPENYFVSYIFKTEKELKDAEKSGLLEEIENYHIEKMREYGYPEEGIRECVFASQEECDRDYKGNWYYYYK